LDSSINNGISKASYKLVEPIDRHSDDK